MCDCVCTWVCICMSCMWVRGSVYISVGYHLLGISKRVCVCISAWYQRGSKLAKQSVPITSQYLLSMLTRVPVLSIETRHILNVSWDKVYMKYFLMDKKIILKNNSSNPIEKCILHYLDCKRRISLECGLEHQFSQHYYIFWWSLIVLKQINT